MLDRNTARGIFLLAISLIFGLQALQYPIGSMRNAGPGLFPLIVSGLLLLIALITLLRARLMPRESMGGSYRNIVIILASLCGFAITSKFANMTLGIVVLVFCSAIAGKTYSIRNNLQVSAGLIAVAFAFQKLLGLNLPLV
jgi:hypothetical protein